jgi:hypothetical protein
MSIDPHLRLTSDATPAAATRPSFRDIPEDSTCWRFAAAPRGRRAASGLGLF